MKFLPEPLPSPKEAIGVILVNLGTPDSPTPPAVRTYLKEFLSDPRVVEIPKLLWWPILNGIILNTRPKKSAAKYASIWQKEGSPLKVWTEKQAKLLKGLLGEQHPGARLKVGYAMRYGQPAIDSVMRAMKADGCNRFLIVPLYPQYASSTTGSVFDAVGATLARWRDQPSLRTIRSFHDHPSYIAALAGQVKKHWQEQGRGDHLLLSFHGIPQVCSDQGDPYQQQCQETGTMLAQALGLRPDEYTISFQSRFGPSQWLQPYTSEILHRLGQQKIGKLDVICPGFTSDCLETLEEIAIEGKAEFLAADGKDYRYIPCLNDAPNWIATLAEIVNKELSGWQY